ncbi:hypothetical protein LTR94_031924, partial [Friedmanniomyces endolithicus]
MIGGKVMIGRRSAAVLCVLLAGAAMPGAAMSAAGAQAPAAKDAPAKPQTLAERFGAVSVTLEMPFKDHDPNPDATFGWSGERSAQLGVSCLEVLTEMIGT